MSMLTLLASLALMPGASAPGATLPACETSADFRAIVPDGVTLTALLEPHPSCDCAHPQMLTGVGLVMSVETWAPGTAWARAVPQRPWVLTGSHPRISVLSGNFRGTLHLKVRTGDEERWIVLDVAEVPVRTTLTVPVGHQAVSITEFRMLLREGLRGRHHLSLGSPDARPGRSCAWMYSHQYPDRAGRGMRSEDAGTSGR